MKIYSGILATSVLTALMAAGCNTTSARYEAGQLRPAIMVEGPKQMMVGESQRIVAHTTDLGSAKAITWAVEPNSSGVRIQPDNNTNGQTAMFSANQRGTFIITARADLGNGQQSIVSNTTVDVAGTMNPNTTTTERMNEPAPR